MKYRAKFYIEDTGGNKWAETCTPLWNSYEVADNNARQYAEYVNSRTPRTVTGWTILECDNSH
jgi:hypothetical protein